MKPDMPESKSCAVCSKPVVLANGSYTHDGGGIVTQKCNGATCGWSGGQAGKFSQCPSCGDATQLSDDHNAQ